MTAIDLRLGRYQDTLANLEEFDAVIGDPPYGERTHDANDESLPDGRRELSYTHWTPEDVDECVDTLAPRCRSWFAMMTSHDLIPAWEAAYKRHNRYAFAPVVIVQKRFRHMQDGPASDAVYLMVSRPREERFVKFGKSWGALPGHYIATIERGGHIGGKPLPLMQAIVRHYSRKGDLIVDPVAGGGTTLLAGIAEGREVIGSEVDPATHATALERLGGGVTLDLFAGLAQ